MGRMHRRTASYPNLLTCSAKLDEDQSVVTENVWRLALLSGSGSGPTTLKGRRRKPNSCPDAWSAEGPTGKVNDQQHLGFA
uniref:Uncharacterized protein n=1 Tax=Papilio xuthus TaxID=66420 RepID=I4DLN2_PAPXU|nr:unknown unsecreted protein [Papilio xuthus]